MVSRLDQCSPPRSVGNRWVSCRPHDQLGLFEGMLRPNVPQKLQEAHRAWQVGVAEASKDPQGGLEQGEQTRRPMLMHVPPCVLLLGVIDARVHGALHRPRAAGRVGRQSTARMYRQVGGLLHRLHGAIAGRLDDHRVLTADPGKNGWPVFLSMAPTRLALLAVPTCRPPTRRAGPSWRPPWGRELYRYRDTPGLSGATYHCRTRVSLEQASRRHQPGVARETQTNCGLSHAHGRGIARVCGHPTAGPTVLSTTMLSTSPGIKGQRPRPQRP